MKTYIYAEKNGEGNISISADHDIDAENTLKQLVKHLDDWKFMGKEEK